MEVVGVPSYSTHWMGLNTTPSSVTAGTEVFQQAEPEGFRRQSTPDGFRVLLQEVTGYLLCYVYPWDLQGLVDLRLRHPNPSPSVLWSMGRSRHGCPIAARGAQNWGDHRTMSGLQDSKTGTPKWDRP